jgi:hypothetical protein
MADLAPIAVFAFKRPEHTRQTLESLSKNPEFLQSQLHIFCDGPRHPGEAESVTDTRRIIEELEHP